MKRWQHYKTENTPEHYDEMWAEQDNTPGMQHFDAGRPEQLARRVRERDKVCDLGAGCWSAGQWLLERTNMMVEVHAVDFSEYALNWLKARHPNDSRLHTVLSRVERTPFMDGEFDAVMAGELIEHVEEPTALVREMARICRVDGWITISTVDMHCDDAVNNRVFYHEHIWDFTPADLVTLFKPYGKAYYFRFGNYHMIECQRLGRNSNAGDRHELL